MHQSSAKKILSMLDKERVYKQMAREGYPQSEIMRLQEADALFAKQSPNAMDSSEPVEEARSHLLSEDKKGSSSSSSEEQLTAEEMAKKDFPQSAIIRQIETDAARAMQP